MYASTLWTNDYLNPPANAEEQAELLTMTGFPLEGTIEVDLPNGEKDTQQDFEMTSNRGDCISHIGLAREIAASSHRKLVLPSPKNNATGPAASEIVTVTNHEPDRCPLYTARIIRGVKVRPSPEWLANRLIAIGQIPRNNIVDATNFVLYESGQPTHVFDLKKIKGSAINIRMAKKDEPFLPIGDGEKEIKLRKSDLVIADAENTVAIGGVKGGANSAVTDSTTDILIEAATFHPVTVRNTSRALKIDSASSYRYERGVHAAHINPAAERLVELLLQLAGGELCEGVVSDGAPIPDLKQGSMRISRCNKILGVTIPDTTILESLKRLGFSPVQDGDTVTCTIPCHRLDIEREIDLIEEVGRMYGHSNIPIVESIPIRVMPVQPLIMGRRAITEALVGMGYVETVTHSLVDEQSAAPFFGDNEHALSADDDRAKATPILRPSLLASVLRVRKLNEDRGNTNLALFEAAATFADTKKKHREHRSLALLLDAEDPPTAIRNLRGTLDRLIEIATGSSKSLDVTPTTNRKWLQSSASGTLMVDGNEIGHMGLVSTEVLASFGIETPVAAAELTLEPLLANYPPLKTVETLPAYPSIERDLSIIVEDSTRWADIVSTIRKPDLDMLEDIAFVTTYRGKQIEADHKSVTVRLVFRSPDRTLTHEEVDPQVVQAVGLLEKSLHARIRT